MWWFLANLDFWQWLWVVVHGLLVVVGWLSLVGRGGGSVCGVFIVVNILLYCDIYIILLC